MFEIGEPRVRELAATPCRNWLAQLQVETFWSLRLLRQPFFICHVFGGFKFLHAIPSTLLQTRLEKND